MQRLKSRQPESQALPGLLPTELTDAPGLVREAMRWAEAALERANRQLAFGALLSTLGTLAAGRFRVGAVRPNLNVLIVAPSPAGKTTAIHWAHELFGWNLPGCYPVIGGFASPAAFRQTVEGGQAFLWEHEHIDTHLPCAMTERCLDHFTAGDSVGNLLFTRIPYQFDEDARRDKTLRRLAESSLIFASGFGDGPMNKVCPAPAMPASLADALAWWIKPAGEIAEIPATSEAEALLSKATDAKPYGLKLAMLHAASADPEKPLIGNADAEWGVALARRCSLDGHETGKRPCYLTNAASVQLSLPPGPIPPRRRSLLAGKEP